MVSVFAPFALISKTISYSASGSGDLVTWFRLYDVTMLALLRA